MAEPKYEIWVDPNSIIKVSLKQISQIVLDDKSETVYFAEIGETKMLIHFVLRQDSRLLTDGKHRISSGIVRIHFAIVEEYKRLLIYNHVTDLTDYSSPTSGLKISEYDHVFFVLNFPDAILRKISEAIYKKIKSEGVSE